jgi:hypothetical protein
MNKREVIVEDNTIQPASSFQPPVPPDQPVTPKPSRKWLWVLLIAGGVLVAICFCVSLFVLVAGGSATMFSQGGNAAQTVDAFMQAMSNKDVDKAYALFSRRAQRQMQLSKIEEMLKGANFALFDGYNKVQVLNTNISQAVNTNTDVPQGTVARINGIVSYEGEYTGQFQAVLELEDKIWKLHSINVTVPPAKFESYIKSNP